jgi:hypothetical protein
MECPLLPPLATPLSSCHPEMIDPFVSKKTYLMTSEVCFELRTGSSSTLPRTMQRWLRNGLSGNQKRAEHVKPMGTLV